MSDLGFAWDELEGQEFSADHMAVRPVGRAPGGPMYVAVDGDRVRHLLVPADPGAKVPVDRRSKGVILIGQELEVEAGKAAFADLVCVDPNLNEVFVRLAEDVASRVSLAKVDGPAVVHEVLGEWRELLSRRSRMGVSESVGLFGELEILRRVVEAVGAGALNAWQGPHQARHDFVSTGASVEVKTSTRREGRLCEIHGVEQLEPPACGQLILAWVALREDVAGITLYEQVERVLNAGTPKAALLNILGETGYEHDRGASPDTRWVVRESHFYVVDDSFPHITAGSFKEGLPTGVQNVSYVVDLAVARSKLDDAEIDTLLAGMA